MTTYKALVGIEFNDTRLEEGEESSTIPASSRTWLISQGLIEEVVVTVPKTSSRSKKAEEIVLEEIEEEEA